MKNDIISFHGKQEIKEEYLKRLNAHQLADEITQGHYWQNGKGCAVGCTVHSSDHSAYEGELGIPIIIAKLEDRIFEGLDNKLAKEFPLSFLSAIPVGKNLDPVWRKFMVWLLIDPTEGGVIKFAKREDTKKAIQDVADLITRSLTEDISQSQFIEVRSAARKAADDEAYAAYDSAAAYADAAAAAYAAYAAADAALTAAYAAAPAPALTSAANAYAAADAAAVHKLTARKNKFKAMAEKLIQLLSEA